MAELECRIKKIEALRVPGINRASISCTSNVYGVIEMPEAIMSLKPDEIIKLIITEDKEECLKHDFCGHGIVVSTTKFENAQRIVISIGGLLLVLNSPSKTELTKLKNVEKYYIGLKKLIK